MTSSRAANDNHAAAEDFSVLDLIPCEDDDKVDETVRRTERLAIALVIGCLLYTSPSPRDGLLSRMPSSA